MNLSTRLALSACLAAVSALVGEGCTVYTNGRGFTSLGTMGNYNAFGYRPTSFPNSVYYQGGQYQGNYFPQGYYPPTTPFVVQQPVYQQPVNGVVPGNYTQTDQFAQQRAQAQAAGVAPPVGAFQNPTRPIGYIQGTGQPTWSMNQCWQQGCVMP